LRICLAKKGLEGRQKAAIQQALRIQGSSQQGSSSQQGLDWEDAEEAEHMEVEYPDEQEEGRKRQRFTENLLPNLEWIGPHLDEIDKCWKGNNIITQGRKILYHYFQGMIHEELHVISQKNSQQLVNADPQRSLSGRIYIKTLRIPF
jgi:hypothetical protein